MSNVHCPLVDANHLEMLNILQYLQLKAEVETLEALIVDNKKLHAITIFLSTMA